MIVYQFLYCGCIHESAYATMSLHKTKEGAERAMNVHKEFERKEFNERYSDEFKKEIKFGMHEDWAIGEIELKD